MKGGGGSMSGAEENKDWYSNKEIYEMVQTLMGDLRGMSTELRQTREVVKKYNGLREEVGRCWTAILTLQQQAAGRSAAGKSVRDWTGYILALLMTIVALLQFFGKGGTP